MPDVLPFAAISNAAAVGGKAFALARMAAAGLPVPPGFAITADAYRAYGDTGPRQDIVFAAEILTAYRHLGGGPVAVRSSATAEDGADASFAGQQDTFLNVTGDDALLDAVMDCWHSLHSGRAVAYRREQGVSDAGLAMAVVVQRMVPATAAGVLFTRDPRADTPRMLVEAAPGLGEAVVSGAVTPDRFALDPATGAILDGKPGCLTDTALSRLAALGRQVEALFGGPRDVEFAVVGDEVFLLQARPITAAASDREQIRWNVMTSLIGQSDSVGTVWVRYNLSEVLPEPTPMTWAVVGRLLAADGGFGAMTRDLGGRPDPALGSGGVFDLVAGRPMCNLSKLPRMQLARPPFVYPFAEYKADPKRAMTPVPTLNPLSRGVFGLPGLVWRMWRMSATSRRLSKTFADDFRIRIAPVFAAAARKALAEDWNTLSSQALLARFREWTDKTLIDFARHSLKATVFADMAWGTLVTLLTPSLGEVGAKASVTELAIGATADADADLAGAVRRLSDGELSRDEFLNQFGHRGPNEMELSSPRWAEEPGRLTAAPRGTLASIRLTMAESALPPPAAGEWVDRLRTYLGLREAGKHYLLLGYAVIRRALVELDRRHDLNDGIFFLLPDELPDLIAGRDLSGRIAERRKRRRLELSLELPAVLFSDDLDAIGRPEPPTAGATVFDGTPVSAGTADGPAVVLFEPTLTGLPERFVLVCPSTDPAWVPLFARAAAVVLETGGVLSHGAIVAREFARPAVAGLPGITRQVKTGQRLRVDGTTGRVAVIE